MRARPGCGRMKTEQRLSLLVGMSFDMRNPGRSELEWVVKLPAPCSLCGNENLECVARLLQKRDFVCSFCGRTMDLTSDAWKAILTKVAETLQQLQPAYNELPGPPPTVS